MTPEENLNNESEELPSTDSADSTAQSDGAPQLPEAGTEPPTAGQQALEDKPDAPAGSETDSALSGSSDYTNAAGRKLFFEVQKMGGERVFEASRKMSDTFFNQSPDKFVQEIQQYPKAFYPVRDFMVIKTIQEQPEDILQLLQQYHPKLLPGAQPSGQQNDQPAENAFDDAAWAKLVLEDPNAYPDDRRAAQRILDYQRQLAELKQQAGKLPDLEKRMQSYEQRFEQTTQQQRQEQAVKYTDGLLSVVDAAYEKSGLKASGIDLEVFRNAIVAAHGKDKAADAVLRRALDAIHEGDMQTALLLEDQIKRDAERIAFQYARQLAGARRQAGQDAERPKVLPAGVAAPIGNQPQTGPAFDESRYQSAMNDILARTS